MTKKCEQKDMKKVVLKQYETGTFYTTRTKVVRRTEGNKEAAQQQEQKM